MALLVGAIVSVLSYLSTPHHGVRNLRHYHGNSGNAYLRFACLDCVQPFEKIKQLVLSAPDCGQCCQRYVRILQLGYSDLHRHERVEAVSD